MLEGFASHLGPDFYGLPRNEETLTLVRRETEIPGEWPFGDTVVMPWRGGTTTAWTVEN